MADVPAFDDIPSFDDLPDAGSPVQASAGGGVPKFDDIPSFDDLPDAPAPEGMIATGAREAAHAALPAAAGFVGMGAGASYGAAAGAIGGPAGAIAGGIVGGIIGGVGSSMAVNAVQEKGLELAGFDDSEQRASNIKENKWSGFIGGQIPAVAGMSVAAGASKLAPLANEAIQRGAGAVFGGGMEAGQEYLNEGHVDPAKVAAAAAVGAVFPGVNKQGAKLVGAGERAVQRFVPGRPNQPANPAAEAAHADVSDPNHEVDVASSSLAADEPPRSGTTTGNPQSAPVRSERVYSKGVPDAAEQARYAEAASDPEAMREFAFQEGLTEAEAREIVQANHRPDMLTQGEVKPDVAAALEATNPAPSANPPGWEAGSSINGERPLKPVGSWAEAPAANNMATQPNGSMSGPADPMKPASFVAPGAQKAIKRSQSVQKMPEPTVEAGFPKEGEPVAVGANEATPVPERATSPEFKGQTNTNPTEAQKAAGNYEKMRSHDFGRPMKVETPAGAVRKGVGPDGTPWEHVSPYDYGYFNKTIGKDKDHIDWASPPIDSPMRGNKHFIIDQKNLETGKFDEHKVFRNYVDEAAARQHYAEGFGDGRGAERLGAITEVERPAMVKWLAKHQTKAATKPYAMQETVTKPGQKVAPKEKAVFKDLLAKAAPEDKARLQNAPDEAIAAAIEGKRLRKYGVSTGSSNGYPIQGITGNDGRPVTAKTQALANERSAAHKKVADWFEGSAPKDPENETHDQLISRLIKNTPSLEGWKPVHKPKEWMLAREAQRFIQKPSEAAAKKFREAERLLRGGDEAVENYRGGNRVEADIARSKRSGDDAVANAEAKNVDLGRNSVEEAALDKIDADRAASMKEAESVGKSNADSALDQWKDYGSVEESVASYRDNLYDTMQEMKMTEAQQRAAEREFERIVAPELRKNAKFDVPHEEAEAMVKPTPVKTRADLKELPRKTIDAADSSLAKIDTKAISATELRKAEAAKLAGKKSEKAANVESEGAAAPVKQIKITDPAEMAKIMEAMNKATSKKAGLDALPAERMAQPKGIQDLLGDFVSDERGSLDLGKIKADIKAWKNGVFAKTEPKSYRAMELRTGTDRAAQKVSDDLQAVKKRVETMWVENLKRLDAIPKEFKTPEAMGKIYDARENDSAHFPLPAGQTGTHIDNLPPALKKVFDDHLKPMFDENNTFVGLIRQLDDTRVGADVNDHISRIVKGDDAAKDILKQDDDPTSPTYHGLSVNADAAKNRRFYALVGADGRRHVIAPNGKGFTKWQNYKPERIKDKNFEFKDGQIYKAGKNDYTMRQATTKEIEAHARGDDGKPMRYYRNAGFSAAVANTQLGAMMRNLTDLHAITQTPEFKKLSTHNEAKALRMDPPWVESKLPNMKGTYLHPELAKVADDFAGNPQTWYNKFNSAITKLIFWMPVAHINNVGTHWFVGRGWDNLSIPANIRLITKVAPRAIKSVINQDGYQAAMRDHGAGLIYGSVKTRRMIEQIAKGLSMDIEKNPGKWGPIADKLGVTTKQLYHTVYDTSSKVMWSAGDVFLTMRVMELEAKGTPLKQAIIEAERDIPNYRVPHQIIGRGEKGRGFSKLMQNSTLTAFGRYHYGMFNSYANIVKDAIGTKATAGDRLDAIGKMMSMGLLAFMIYPIMDKGAKLVTGNDEAKAARRGPLAVPSHIASALKGETDIAQWARGAVTLAPALSAGVGALSGKDFRGKPIVEPGDLRGAFVDHNPKAGARAAAQAVEYGAKTLVSPYGTLSNALQRRKPGESAAIAAGKAVRDATLDIKDPTDKAIKYQRQTPMRANKDAVNRFKKGGSGPLENAIGKGLGYR